MLIDKSEHLLYFCYVVSKARVYKMHCKQPELEVSLDQAQAFE